ncbi:LOW QUALITY PROTEIN: SIN3-HDAC complex-associated factor-like [Entelurus aequoreus]|uniref:LOW QUALITY PROTEIN: SIN3-HDAC complex-associated factor-like n=1 Tax=Entelurus aequoreus TaxID=161455 RepID=UPI002B1DDDFA|nr:LOW QUALITY PROTEIN: SIN3-HDAC complex-associated factor-like [Entelurus aequoreus]
MFGFHKPKMYRSLDGCCICRAKSSSSRFTDSKRYEKDFRSCFGLSETRSGEICNACVLLVKRWKKLPVGTKKNWNHVVDARGGPSLKLTSRPKKMKSMAKKARPSQISRLQKELKRNNSDAHSTTSSTSPAQSPSYSNLSDDGSDTELSRGSGRSPVFSFLDLTYWRRQRVCCGIIYKGRFGEVLIHPHLFKPCKKQQQDRTKKRRRRRRRRRRPTPPRWPSVGCRPRPTSRPRSRPPAARALPPCPTKSGNHLGRRRKVAPFPRSTYTKESPSSTTSSSKQLNITTMLEV